MTLRPMDRFLRDLRSNPPETPQSRRAACTHSSMSWVFSNARCSLCHRIPSLGWLYWCTHDTQFGVKEELESALVEFKGQANADECEKDGPGACTGTKLTGGRPNEYKNVPNYNSLPLLERHFLYTDDQVELIKSQKTNVAEVLTALKITYQENTPPLSVDLSSPVPLYDETASPSSRLSSIDTRSTPETALVPSRPHKLAKSKPFTSWTRSRTRTPATSESANFSECGFHCCVRCRPGFLDRSWISVNAVLAGEQPVPPPHLRSGLAAEERPVSKLCHVRNLGLRKEQEVMVWHADPDTLWDSDTSGDDSWIVTRDPSPLKDISGLRASIKRAFRGIVPPGRKATGVVSADEDQSTLSTLECTTASSSQGSGVSTANSPSTYRRLPTLAEDLSDFSYQGLWITVEEDSLQEAVATPLPGEDEETQDGGQEPDVRDDKSELSVDYGAEPEGSADGASTLGAGELMMEAVTLA